MNYEYKCERCKRPADYETSVKGNQMIKTPVKQCGDPRCKGTVKLMWD